MDVSVIYTVSSLLIFFLSTIFLFIKNNIIGATTFIIADIIFTGSFVHWFKNRDNWFIKILGLMVYLLVFILLTINICYLINYPEIFNDITIFNSLSTAVLMIISLTTFIFLTMT